MEDSTTILGHLSLCPIEIVWMDGWVMDDGDEVRPRHETRYHVSNIAHLGIAVFTITADHVWLVCILQYLDT